VKVNCAAMPMNLIESEMFGHEKGAFTGAIRQKAGKFELSNKGTIFLDEIGAISLEVQVKLLRVIQEREFERVGGTHTIKSDVRIMAATNKNLEEAVEKGEFRDDLYYRLNVFPIYMPPLRERKTDILLLADFFLEKYATANQKDIRSFSKTTIDMLMQYHWPGNVRELENCIERAVLLCEENVIPDLLTLPPSLPGGEGGGPRARKLPGGRRGGTGTGSDDRNAEKHTGQHGQGLETARPYGKKICLQGEEVRNRFSLVQVRQTRGEGHRAKGKR